MKSSPMGSIWLIWIYLFIHSVNFPDCLMFTGQALEKIQGSNIKQIRQGPIKVNIYDIFTEINV